MATSPMTPKVTRSSLREQVRDILRLQIITGEVEPGRLYSVNDFLTLLGVSQTPIREALGDLEQAGLVQVIRNRGFIVPSLTDHDLDEIFQLRTMLEVSAIDYLVEVELDPDAVRTCRRTVELCLASAQEGNLAEFLEADREFHLELVRMLGNNRLVETVNRIRDQTRLYGVINLTSEDLATFAKEHEELFDAVLARDGARARTLLRKHLQHTRQLWSDP